jgi:hypothetical protein
MRTLAHRVGAALDVDFDTVMGQFSEAMISKTKLRLNA